MIVLSCISHFALLSSVLVCIPNKCQIAPLEIKTSSYWPPSFIPARTATSNIQKMTPPEVDKRLLAFFSFENRPSRIYSHDPADADINKGTDDDCSNDEPVAQANFHGFPIKGKNVNFSSKNRSRQWLMQNLPLAKLFISREHPHMSDFALLSTRPLPSRPKTNSYTKGDYFKDAFKDENETIDLVALHLYLDRRVFITHRDRKENIYIDEAATAQFTMARERARRHELAYNTRLLSEWCTNAESSGHVFGTNEPTSREAARNTAAKRIARMARRTVAEEEERQAQREEEDQTRVQTEKEEAKKRAEEKREQKKQLAEEKRWERLTDEEKLSDARLGKRREGASRMASHKWKWKIATSEWNMAFVKTWITGQKKTPWPGAELAGEENAKLPASSGTIEMGPTMKVGDVVPGIDLVGESLYAEDRHESSHPPKPTMPLLEAGGDDNGSGSGVMAYSSKRVFGSSGNTSNDMGKTRVKVKGDI